MQDDVVVSGNHITGTLKFIEGGLDPTPGGVLSGDGYFLALHWSDPDEDVTSLKVGLSPSRGTGLVECLDDADRNGVFKISNKREQRFVILQEADGVKSRKEYDLSRLVLGDAE